MGWMMIRRIGAVLLTLPVAAAFSAATSPRPDESDCAGPLTVVRLLRTLLPCLSFFAVRECFWSFDGREDFAMGLRCQE